MALARCGKFLLSQRILSTSSRLQHGYIILLPEIGEEAPEKNPLYENDGLTKFNEITIENCRSAIAKQALEFEMGIQKIESEIEENHYEDVFDSIIQPMEKLGIPMETTWGLSKTLYLGNNTLMPTSSYMAIHDRGRRARAAKYTSKKIHFALKDAFLKETERTTEENRILQKFVLEGKLNGLELNEKDSGTYSFHFGKLVPEKQQFKVKNDLSVKQHSQMIRDPKIVRDFPEDLLKATAVNPNQYMTGPWKFTLLPQVYGPLMEHCPDREIRYLLWRENANRGSVGGERELATSLHVEEIRFVKRNIAKILGYETYVDMSMETKMAGSRLEVDQFIRRLLSYARPAQEAELQSLVEFANERGFKTDKLELWDVPYWRRKQLKHLFHYSDNDLKDFFPLNTVLDGLFQLCEKLFNIIIKARSGVSTWHKDVRFYDIFEPHSSAPVAGFYFDPYARSEDKMRIENAGWMVGMQSRSQVTDTKPLAALIFNFEPPTGEKQSHLSFKEVKLLFKKFGHSLQHLLTRTYYAEVAGLSNVEWDAVGTSGNMLTHWLFNEDVIASISSHYGSGDKLPKSTFETLCKAQNHMAGLDLSNELYLCALDLELYSSNDFWLDIARRLWPQYKNFKYEWKIDAHPCQFTEIFLEEWGAAYYSHLWSRMLAADVYSAFYEVRDDEQQVKDVGKRYRDTFLAMGGSQHASQIFREFRGRDPSHKALLKTLGFKKNKEDS